MNHIDFVILNSYVTVIYLRFIKNTYLLVVKNKKKLKHLSFSLPFTVFPCHLLKE